MKPLFIISALFTILILAPLTAQAEDLTPPAPIQVTANVVAVNNGASGQTDPHISGDWVSYTDNSNSRVNIQNLAQGSASDRPIQRPDGTYDSLSDISGNQVVFMRADSIGNQRIYSSEIDPFGNPTEAQEVSPLDNSLRRRAAVGSGTIGWEDRSYDSSSSAQLEIALFDPAVGETIRLTTDTVSDQSPAVSSDGSVVVWLKCASSSDCDVWQAKRDNGWTPVQLTGIAGEPAGNESLPATDGGIVVYGSNASGGDDIYYRPIAGGPATHLSMPGVQRNPNISGNVISFESSAAPGAQFDLMVYDLLTQVLYQVTNTAVSETLSDISGGPGDLVRIVWAQPKQVYPYDMDVYALDFLLQSPQTPSLTVRSLSGNSHAHRAGSIVPLRIQILNGEGANISSPDLVLTATGLVRKDDTSITAVIDDAGNANPDNAFRYDASLQGYVFNLSTKNMASGTWELQFLVSGDSTTYTVEFNLR